MLLPFPKKRWRMHDRLFRSIGKRIFSDAYKVKFSNSAESAFIAKEFDAHAKRFFQNSDNYEIIENFIQNTKSTGASWSDYLVIYEYVVTKKPRYILELGSGVSSVIFALANERVFNETNRRIKIVSMESDRFYYKNIKELFPTSLSDFVDFNLSPNVFEMVCGITTSCYQNLPDFPYEFVFVDGPPAFDLCCGDALKLILNADIEIDVITDRRIATVSSFNRLFKPGVIGFDYIRNLGLGHKLSNKNLQLDCLNKSMHADHHDAFNFFGLASN